MIVLRSKFMYFVNFLQFKWPSSPSVVSDDLNRFDFDLMCTIMQSSCQQKLHGTSPM